MKAILLSLDLLLGLLIFFLAIALIGTEFFFENKPSLYYYDSSNAIDFFQNEIKSKNEQAINESIYNYLGYKEYYLLLNYYNESGLTQKIEINDFKKKSNYCSKKNYMINNELVEALMCISREWQ